jgi:signal transduction histidine kinase
MEVMMENVKQIFHENSLYDIDLLVTALNTTSDGLMIVDTNYNILYKNVAADYMLGGIGDRFDFDDWRKQFCIRDIKTKKILKTSEMPIVRAVNGLKFNDLKVVVNSDKEKDGYYLSCNGTPLIGRNDKIIGGVLTFRNITDSYISERILAQDRAFYKNILDLIPGCVFVKDGTHNYYFTNQEFDILRRQLKDVDPELRAKAEKEVEEHDKDVISSLIAKDFDEDIELGNGEVKHFTTIRFPIYHQASDKVLICGIAFDITERKRIEDNLEIERLRSINASKLASIGTLAGEIGHEINNPIAVIKSITFLLREMIEDHSLTEVVLVEKINTIEATLDRISKIIKSLKNLSRKGLNEVREVCSLKHVLSDVMPLVELKLRKNGVKLSYDSSHPILEEKISCFHVQLGEVLMNLLTNASDAVEKSENPSVKMSFSESEKEILIRIQDNGTGVPLPLRDKIFEPFFTTKVLGKGTGLGLSISKNILKMHEGDLLLEPSETGASFLIRLPKHSTR